MSVATEGRARHRLLARYGAVFRTAWAHRREIAGPRRMADELAFLPAALSLQETPLHPAPRRVAWAVMALFTIALAWSVLGQVDIVAVAHGRLIVSERTKLVQPLERSVVRQILVRDGEQVRAGQALVELDPTAAGADRASITERLQSALAEDLRAQALLAALASGSAPSLAGTALLAPADLQAARRQLQAEWNDIQARVNRLQAEHRRRLAEIATVRMQIAKLEATLPLAREREQDIRSLAEQGFMARHAGQDRMRERIELERDLAAQRARMDEAEAAARESEQGLASLRADTVRRLRDREAQARLEAALARQEQVKAARRERLTTLAAPVDATVQQLAVHTVGGVVTEAQPLMVLVPRDARLVAEVALENRDIGFVDIGQAAEIKLETFPYTRYGTVAARVLTVTSDAVADEQRGAIFPATLGLDSLHLDIDGRRVALAPGMNVTAEIKTGTRRVIDYLLSPIQRAGRESLKER